MAGISQMSAIYFSVKSATFLVQLFGI